MHDRDRLLEIFQGLEFEASDISDGTNLRDELGIDSTEFAEIAVAIERELHVVVNDDELNQVKTFGDLVQFVSSAPPAKQGD
jgi:acyl carrier protein